MNPRLSRNTMIRGQPAEGQGTISANGGPPQAPYRVARAPQGSATGERDGTTTLSGISSTLAKS